MYDGSHVGVSPVFNVMEKRGSRKGEHHRDMQKRNTNERITVDEN